MEKPRIAFVLYEYQLGFSAMIINSILLFARRGHAVDVYIDAPTHRVTPIEFRDSAVRIHLYEGASSKAWRVWALAMCRMASNAVAKRWPFAIALAIIFPRLFLFARWLRREMSKTSYGHVFPVEAASLLALHGIAGDPRIVYWDMELLDWSGNDPNYDCKAALKHLQARMLRRAAGAVIQSPRRAEAFARINAFDRARIHVLPVAAMGPAVERRGRHFRDKFSIADDVTVVLYAGNFTGWAQCVEIIDSVRQWPERHALVMHTWQAPTLQTPYFREMERAAAGLPVFFSADFLDYDVLAAALSSADIGILLYEPINENFTEILFSSNKLAEYLKAGLPVISSDFPSLREFVERWDIGVAVPSPAAVPQAVRAMAERLETLRANARRCYEAELRFERHFDAFHDALTGSAAGRT